MVERDQNGKLIVRRRLTRKDHLPAVRQPEVPDEHGVVRNVEAMCEARRVDGEPCRAYAIKGANVCARHGGSAPQVRRKAAVRLAMASDWLMFELLNIAKSSGDEKTRLSAIVAALDRAGFGPKTNIELEMGAHTLQAFERTMAASIRRLPADGTALHPVIEAEVADLIADGQAQAHRYRPATRNPASPAAEAKPEPEPETANPPGHVRTFEDLYGDASVAGTGAAEARARLSSERRRGGAEFRR